MCGITGTFAYHPDAPPVDREALLRTHNHMRTRGPDGEGLWISTDNRIGLAHRRLAIIDLTETGAQPMRDPETGNQIVFNGEIYNYQALRLELKTSGQHFRSHSDTEVLLKLYTAYGHEMLHKLRGMYAFAIWDNAKQGLFLARDPFGIKPLYLSDNGKTLQFASQVKALLAGKAVDTTPEPAGHVGFFLWGHIPEPYTLYKGIRALPSGTSLWIDRVMNKSQRTFFSIPRELAEPADQYQAIKPQEAQEQLRAALFDSVKHHLVADVPVGIFLSAGLDSSTLTALASEVVQPPTSTGVKSEGSNSLHTITLGFEEFINTNKDETPLAKIVARQYNTQHATCFVQRKDFAEHYERLIAAMDQPSIDGVNTYFVSMAAKQAGLKIALSGLGGDELFAGYSHFREIPSVVRMLGHVPGVSIIGRGFRRISVPFLKHFTSPKYAGLLEYGSDYMGAYLLRRGLFMPWELPEVLDGELVREGWHELQTFSVLGQTINNLRHSRLKVCALETAWYMRNQLLRDTDWASMAHSLEVRVPFVDIELYRVVTSQIHAGLAPGKGDMAKTPTFALPDAVINRKKSGFSVPVREWLMDSSKLSTHNFSQNLREWSLHIKREYIFENYRRHSRKLTIGLLASEVTTRGGIQSFMLRIAEVLNNILEEQKASICYCLSLNDSTRQLKGHPLLSSRLKVFGASRSKMKLLIYALFKIPKTDVLIVGHLGLGPIAYLLKKFGYIQRYHVILHGIEAWKRTSFIERYALSASASNIATTQYTAKECAKYNQITDSHFQIIPLCTDERPVIPSRNFKLQGGFKILCVARQDLSERYKGFEHIFQAMTMLKHTHPNIHLNMIGTGNYQASLKQTAHDLGISHHVTFYGEVTDEELTAAYQDCDIFVMPSKKEGFGIVFLEAIRYGKPCIGGNHGGTPEVIEHEKNGYLVEYGQIDSLANYIKLLIEDEVLRLKFGICGQIYTYSKFSKAQFVNNYQRLIFQSEIINSI